MNKEKRKIYNEGTGFLIAILILGIVATVSIGFAVILVPLNVLTMTVPSLIYAGLFMNRVSEFFEQYEIPNKRYCLHCKHYGGRFVEFVETENNDNCYAKENATRIEWDTHIMTKHKYKFKRKPSEINKSNDCEWYERMPSGDYGD